MPKLVTYDEIAQMSGGHLKAASLRMTASRGELPARAHPKFPVWTEKSIQRWLRDRNIEPQPLAEQ